MNSTIFRRDTDDAIERDTFTVIFKRCLKDSVFRRRFMQDPVVTAHREGYQIPPDDLNELKALAQKVRETGDDLPLPEQVPPPQGQKPDQQL